MKQHVLLRIFLHNLFVLIRFVYFHRLTEDIYQTAKVAKVLLLLNAGKGTDLKGKSLSEIEVMDDLIEYGLEGDNDSSDNGTNTYPNEETSDSLERVVNDSFVENVSNDNFNNNITDISESAKKTISNSSRSDKKNNK